MGESRDIWAAGHLAVTGEQGVWVGRVKGGVGELVGGGLVQVMQGLLGAVLQLAGV